VPIVIHHIHGPSFGPFQSAFSNWVFCSAERYAARVTDHFLCSANAMTRLYLAAGIGQPQDYTRVFSGFDLAPFLESRNDLELRVQLGLSPQAFIIGKVARMAPLKGHEDLLLALRELQSHHPEARVLFVGDGTLRNQIEARAVSLGLADKVIFTGLVPPVDVPRYIGIMDCLVHLSRREALSRALPQALAAGKPVIAYDFDGADEVCLEGETGYLVNMGNVSMVCTRLRQLATDPQLRAHLGGRGREFVRHNFTTRQLVDTQLEIYRKLAAQRGIS
jgi:glycosyltransferase involved in cell wall biosynthesis